MTDRLGAIQQALDAFRRDEARALLKDELKENPSAAACYLASQAALTQGDRVRYLKRALELDPEHQLARDELAAIVPAEMPKAEPVAAARDTRIQAPAIEPAAPVVAAQAPAVEPEGPAKRAFRLASIGKRWLAIVIDGFIVAIVTVLLLIAGGALAPLEAAIANADEAALSAAMSNFQSNTLTINLLVSAVYNVLLMVMFQRADFGQDDAAAARGQEKRRPHHDPGRPAAQRLRLYDFADLPAGLSLGAI